VTDHAISSLDAADRPIEILLLCNLSKTAGNVGHHLAALVGLSRHHVRLVSMEGDLPPRLDLRCFDAVIIHYTLIACCRAYLSSEARSQLSNFRGVKAVFIQDDYRFVNDTVSALREIGISILFTCVAEKDFEAVFPEAELPRVTRINVLTGYVESALLKMERRPLAARPIDVAYRGRDVPMWLGELGQDKVRIAARFSADAPRFGLVTDISTQERDRIYGDAWVLFLTNCKAVLGTESGASVFDFTGEIKRRVEETVWSNPALPFEEVSKLHFEEMEGRILCNVISPRCFEAAALGTLMILYEGEYSGRLVPWRHYVPLRKDHSNMEEVVEILRDLPRAQQIADRAYAEVACNPENGYQLFVDHVDLAIAHSCEKNVWQRRSAYEDRAFLYASAPSLRTKIRHFRRNIIVLLVRGITHHFLRIHRKRSRGRSGTPLHYFYKKLLGLAESLRNGIHDPKCICGLSAKLIGNWWHGDAELSKGRR
jgi:hypothetical protein